MKVETNRKQIPVQWHAFVPMRYHTGDGISHLWLVSQIKICIVCKFQCKNILWIFSYYVFPYDSSFCHVTEKKEKKKQFQWKISIVNWITMTRKSGKHLHMTHGNTDNCFNLIKSHHQCISWYPPRYTPLMRPNKVETAVQWFCMSRTSVCWIFWS